MIGHPDLLISLLLSAPFAAAQICGRDPQAPYCDPTTETCCQDSPTCQGACTECCVKQSTFCVLPRATFTTSTCCSRWTVGCNVGSVGCCDPAKPWQFLGTTLYDRTTNASRSQPQLARNPSKLQLHSITSASLAADIPQKQGLSASYPTAGTSVAHALFTESLVGGLKALTIDAETGAVTSSKSVTGPAASYYANYYGESTRLFPWDSRMSKFVFADLDFAASGTPLNMFTIDPVTGGSTSTPVTGCGSGENSYPFGLAFDQASGTLHIGMQTADTATFCAVDTSSANGTVVATASRGAGEANPEFYSAYLSHVHDGVAYRIGQKGVVDGTAQGVGSTPLTKSTSSTWHDIPRADNHTIPVSIGRHPAGGFISLAPRSQDGSLDIVTWDIGSPSSTVAAALSNAHHPSLSFMGGFLGYVGDSITGTTFGAMVVALHPNPLLPGVLDKWTIVTHDTLTGNTTESALQPQPSALGAETTSLSGFGMVAPPESKAV